MKKRIFQLTVAVLMIGAMLLTACAPTPAASPVASPAGEPQSSASGAPAVPAAPAEPITFADTIAWDGQYDVIVIGFGGAGAIAAKTASDNGAKVLLVEKAPEGKEGGNTRVCGQLFAYGNNDKEATYQYYKALMGAHEVPDDMLRIYTDGIAVMADTLEKVFGADRSAFVDWTGKPLIGAMSPEYPEFPGSEKIGLWTTTEGTSNGKLWELFRKNVTDRSENIDVWFSSPGKSLIQDPVSKTVIGATIEREGKLVSIQAKNGVVLATGGFENNAEMLETYLGLSDSSPYGGLYNTGDGIEMALSVGADLWHMESYEGLLFFGNMTFKAPEGENTSTMLSPLWGSGSIIAVGGDGTRYYREDEFARHGHLYYHGTWANIKRPSKTFAIFDQAQYDQLIEKKQIPDRFAGNIVKADSIAALAQAIDAKNLESTVASFNASAESGKDAFNRAPESMVAIKDGSVYAMEVVTGILNTQGGPRRNANAQIIDREGNPIPNLYSAGELGGITSNQYQGGGNIAECVIFGQIAGTNAAAPKDALPTYTLPSKVESSMVHLPGKTTDIQAKALDVQTGANEYVGEGTGMGGPLVVKITMDGDKIAKVEIVSHNETAGISDPAIANIPGAIVAANSAQVDAVAGATMSSNGIMQAVADALTKVKK